MPPIPPGANPLPRVITYYQTLHDPSGNHISVLPFLTQPDISLTHLILAAIHINDDPAQITLNDHSPDHPRHQVVWAELRVLQSAGIKVMALLGGAAKGSFQRLDSGDAQFERYYGPLRELIKARGLDGVDLDVEEEMTLAGIVRLIDRLRADFGPSFIISMAPVAMALLDFTKNLSGFDYEALEVMRGRDIAWYNTQFYCGWGDASTTFMYDFMIRKGWPAEKIVIGLVTNPANGPGFVPLETLAKVLSSHRTRYERFGGVMGWEYFNSLPGDRDRPWEWARHMTAFLRASALEPTPPTVGVKERGTQEIDQDATVGQPLQVPKQFEYYSDEN